MLVFVLTEAVRHKVEPNHQLTFTSVIRNPTYRMFRSEFHTFHHFGC